MWKSQRTWLLSSQGVGSLCTPVLGLSSNFALSPKEKLKKTYQNLALSLILRISDDQDKGSNAGFSIFTHALAVEQVAGVLNPSPQLENYNHVMSESREEGSDEEDSDMFEYDDPDEPEDSMTLDQYQTRLRKKALIPRVPQSMLTSHKKGRLDQGCNDAQGPCSSS